MMAPLTLQRHRSVDTRKSGVLRKLYKQGGRSTCIIDQSFWHGNFQKTNTEEKAISLISSKVYVQNVPMFNAILDPQHPVLFHADGCQTTLRVLVSFERNGWLSKIWSVFTCNFSTNLFKGCQLLQHIGLSGKEN